MIKVNHLTKRYYNYKNSEEGIIDASFEVKKGEIVAIMGPSGCGKSTLLKLLTGLKKQDSGSYSFGDETKVGYVSQEYTLWPHLTVLENLTLAPLLNSQKKLKTLQDEAKSFLSRFNLIDFANSYPKELSGGQRQRVAILQAVMNKPNILLLDEITSALDPELTKSVLDLIRALAKDGYTMLIVTHHMSFAMSVANRVIFLQKARLICDQDSAEFFTNQKNKEIKSFILDIARKDEHIEVFKGLEQYQAYHLGLMRRLPKKSIIYVAGAVGDEWVRPMGDLYEKYEKLRIKKEIVWKMVTYKQGETDKRLAREHPKLNQFKKMPRNIQNPANYNVFGDTVITQIFEEEPTIIQIKNQKIADAYIRFFEELWILAK
tara:strand:- start:3 stop:1127 length:1125 start_codon:yes stop_codon:yes gene_type:complete